MEHFNVYPDFSHIKSMTLSKPSISQRYGDPNNKDVQRWYLEEGKTYPFPDYLKKNTLLNRIRPIDADEDVAVLSKNHDINIRQEPAVRIEKVYSEFCSKPILSNHQ